MDVCASAENAKVPPLAGGWIEIELKKGTKGNEEVPPLAGGWIEMQNYCGL